MTNGVYLEESIMSPWVAAEFFAVSIGAVAAVWLTAIGLTFVLDRIRRRK